MAYRVEITPQAEADLDQGYCYIARDSPKNALRWWRRFYDVVARLSLFPEAYGHAPENDAVSFDVRQKLYGNYRILFTIDGERVVVLRIRHAARLPLPPDELSHPPSS
jgi:plasmid stabilization system protein ParE